MKKGRHRRFEEARALKRGPDIDIESILDEPGNGGPKPADDWDLDAEHDGRGEKSQDGWSDRD